jgi:hypothetical protein
MSPHTSIELLRIKTCSDPHRWYAGLVGKNVPALGYDPLSGWKSKEPAGYTNYILSQDAERIAVFVPEYLLGRWPYITHKTLAAGTAHAVDAQMAKGFVRKPKPWPVPPQANLAATLPPKTCAGSCDRFGFCQALEGCQDQARIDAQLAAKPKATGQSRMGSAGEAVVNIAVGFGVSVVITAWLLPAMGHQVSLSENLLMTSVFTVASLVRSYAIRRAFVFYQGEK